MTAAAKPRRLYEVKLIHRLHDWDAALKYEASDARQARKFAPSKMAAPRFWIVVSARMVK